MRLKSDSDDSDSSSHHSGMTDLDEGEIKRKLERYVARLNKLKARKAALRAAMPRERHDPSIHITKKDAPVARDANMFDGGVYSHSAPSSVICATGCTHWSTCFSR